jgi:RimJ/RimL family protein N-acetyltransferase
MRTRLKLIPITPDLPADPRIQGSAFLRDLCASTFALHPGGSPELPWAGYLAEEGDTFVGTCAFKTKPIAGEVEIAYFTFPEQEGKGVATQMAQRLIELALEHGVTGIRAQTLPERGASTRILEKLGFVLAGPVHHPEDGEVWEWKWRGRPVSSDQPAEEETSCSRREPEGSAEG